MRKARKMTGLHGEDSDKLVIVNRARIRSQTPTAVQKKGKRLNEPKFQLTSTLSLKKVKDLIKVGRDEWL